MNESKITVNRSGNLREATHLLALFEDGTARLEFADAHGDNRAISFQSHGDALGYLRHHLREAGAA